MALEGNNDPVTNSFTPEQIDELIERANSSLDELRDIIRDMNVQLQEISGVKVTGINIPGVIVTDPDFIDPQSADKSVGPGEERE